jgi:hypothetical protein
VVEHLGASNVGLKTDLVVTAKDETAGGHNL